MSDQNGGLQTIGGLAPIGAPPSGGAGSSPPPTTAPPPAGLAGVGGMGRVGGASPVSPPPSPLPSPSTRVNPSGAALPPLPAASPAPVSAPNLSAAPSVYVPPRAANAEVWEEPSTGGARVVWAAVGGTALVALALGAYFIFRAPPRASAPTGFAAYASGDKLWGFDAPQGWTRTASGAATGDETAVSMNGVVCASGSAKFDVSISTVAGLTTNQLLFGSGPTPEAMTGSHSNGIQDSALKPFKKTFRNYQETEITENLPWKGETIKGFSGNGLTIPDMKIAPDVRLAEYTASSNSWGLGGPVHGYRATVGGKTLIAYAVCQSAERDWPTVKPAFLHMLATVHETPKAVKTISSSPGTGVGNLMAPIGGM